MLFGLFQKFRADRFRDLIGTRCQLILCKCTLLISGQSSFFIPLTIYNETEHPQSLHGPMRLRKKKVRAHSECRSANISKCKADTTFAIHQMPSRLKCTQMRTAWKLLSNTEIMMMARKSRYIHCTTPFSSHSRTLSLMPLYLGHSQNQNQTCHRIRQQGGSWAKKVGKVWRREGKQTWTWSLNHYYWRKHSIEVVLIIWKDTHCWSTSWRTRS